MIEKELAGFIDHTILKADCSKDAILKVCSEAKEYGFAAVCIPPYWVKTSVSLLESTPSKVATVIGFPMGYSATASKVEEIKRAIDDGADELDVVVNLCALKEGNWNYVKNDISTMITAVHLKGKIIKVILETGLLTIDEIKKVSEICLELGADFIKTSTGFNGGGATIEAVEAMKAVVGDKVKIKASGGIRTAKDAISFLEAGADRLGCSSGVAIVTEK